MNISSLNGHISFGRAYTSAEYQKWQDIQKRSNELLDIKNTSAILFDFNVPSQKEFNTGVSTSLSSNAHKFVGFLHKMLGINSIINGPQGEINAFNPSPYSGTSFSLGEHIIDLSRLTNDDYDKILSPQSLKKYQYQGDKSVDYSFALGDSVTKEGNQQKALKEAYDNFKTLSSSSPLKKQFEEFKSKNADWLDKSTLYDAMTEKYGINDSKLWDEEDSYLFSGRYSNVEIEKRKELLKNALNKEHFKKQGKDFEGYDEFADFKKFVQFIADKQLKDSVKEYEKEGIKVFGDCLIGFSDKEFWSYRDCFKEDEYMGWEDLEGNKGTWGPIPDYSKFKDPQSGELGPVGKLFAQKFDLFFSRYSGVRMDAAWQLVAPISFKYGENGELIKQQNLNLGTQVIDLMSEYAQKHGVDKNDINFELLGDNANEAILLLKNEYPMIHITRYPSQRWGREKYYEEISGYKRDKFSLGVGTADNKTLVELSQNEDERKTHAYYLSQDLGLPRRKMISNEAMFRNAKMAELFSAQNQFFTTPDIFGTKNPINPSESFEKSCWDEQVPSNYEEFYHSQISKQYGLNPANAKMINLQNHMKTLYDNEIEEKEECQKLIDMYKKADEILLQDGPMNQAKADKELGKNFSAFG